MIFQVFYDLNEKYVIFIYRSFKLLTYLQTQCKRYMEIVCKKVN